MTGSEIHILSTGGVFNEDSLSLQGNLAKENIRRYHVDLALLSCKGLDMDKGIMDSSEREADVKTEMVKTGTRSSSSCRSYKNLRERHLYNF